MLGANFISIRPILTGKLLRTVRYAQQERKKRRGPTCLPNFSSRPAIPSHPIPPTTPLCARMAHYIHCSRVTFVLIMKAGCDRGEKEEEEEEREHAHTLTHSFPYPHSLEGQLRHQSKLSKNCQSEARIPFLPKELDYWRREILLW